MTNQPAQDANIYGPVEIEGLSFVIFQDALYVKDESLAAKIGVPIETFREALEKARDALVAEGGMLLRLNVRGDQVGGNGPALAHGRGPYWLSEINAWAMCQLIGDKLAVDAGELILLIQDTWRDTAAAVRLVDEIFANAKDAMTTPPNGGAGPSAEPKGEEGFAMINGELRISSLTLAKQLGISHEKLLARIEANRSHLEALGSLGTTRRPETRAERRARASAERRERKGRRT